MNILITGGAGFIGSNLAEKLIKDHNIIVIDNFNDYYSPAIKENNIKEILKNPKYKLYRADVRNIEEIKPVFSENSIDCVVHIAASAGVRASIKEPDLFIKNNICATVNVLELMKDFNVKKLVFASSSSVYGNCKAEKFSEDLKITEPISPYAATKSACEQFIYTFSKLYDIQAVCLRFFTVYGRRQRPDLAISKFVNLIKQDKPIPVYGDGTTFRDYTYIDDILSGIKSAIYYNKTPYEIINLGGGEPVTLIDMIKTIEQVLGKKAQIEWLPMQAGDVIKTSADRTKAKNLLNFEPKTKFIDGIKAYTEWANGKE